MTDQTVAPGQGEADATPKAVVEDSPGAVDAQEDDLDTILKEVSPDDFKPEPEKEETKDDDIKAVLSYVKEQQSKQLQGDVDDALKSAVESMGEYSDAVKASPPELRRGFLLLKAEENSALLTAFTNRDKDPDTWNRIVKATAKSYDDILAKQPDAQLTSDLEAALASVRGVSNTAPTSGEKSPKEIRAMTDAEMTAYNASGGRT